MFKFLKRKLNDFEKAIEEEIQKEKKEKERTEKERELEKRVEEDLRKTIELEKEIKVQQKKKTLPISEKKLDALLWDLEMGLLQADVAIPVVEDIKKSVKEQLAYIPRKDARNAIEEILKKAIEKILSTNGEDFETFIKECEKPVVLMFVGVNGTGKTTAIAKLVYHFQKKGWSCVIGACDTFRAGAIEQLERHAEKLGVKLIKHAPGSDPAAVAYDAIEHAKAKHKDIVLLDTAGRMQTNVNLMDEMRKIKRVAKPDMIIFVGDALTGNDAVEQAKRFDNVVGIDGTILTKVDADAKGGAALSIAYTIGKPLLFIGTGQEYEDQIPFKPEWMIKRLFD
ncbi:MAG: signal recognition particle-docking protein FtsY [Thermoplasmata archaeon]|nr:MAG: signal recognition particle-docking protein FtsY [Thermoplasmata archaeon]